MRFRALGYFLALAAVVMPATAAHAQLAAQTALVGIVTDTGGGVLPGATVVAVNQGTKDTYEAITNAQGQYNLQFVRPGGYTITVTVPGFQTFRATGVEVTTNQVVRTNAVLQVGALQEEVLVEARAAVLATDRSTVSDTIDERQITELPSRGRNVWQMAEITPGVQRGTRGGTWIGAGQRDIQNSLTLDGINAAANLMPSTSMQPIADAVEEIVVQTGSTSAEFGSYLGVHVNVVTKSGTNTPHGSLSYFYQGDALDARGFFENRSAPKNPRTYNQFSVQTDGPVVIPGFYDGRNRTFFMAAYEGIRQDQQSAAIATVPTSLMRQGNFSEVATQLRDPLTGQPYPGNIIPPSQLSPIALRFLQEFFPAPSRPGLAANLVGSSAQNVDQDQVLLRIDQNIGNRARVYFRYNWQDEFTDDVGIIPVTGSKQPRTNTNYLGTYTHTIRPNLLNDFRIGYHSVPEDTLNYFFVNGLTSAGADLGIPGFDGDVRFNNPGIPDISLTGFSGLGLGGTNWLQFDRTFQLSNILALNRGSHNLRAGFDARRVETGRQAANSPRGNFAFDGQMTGHAVADFMVGLPRSVRTPVNQIQGHVGHWRNGLFVNDTWQATRNVTLSLGLRYELHTPVQTYAGLATMLTPDFTRIIPETLPAVGFEFHDPNNNLWAPRLGATYRLSEKTVFRGGWGIYYNPNQMNTFTFLTNNPPLAAEFTFFSDPANPTLSFTSPFGVVGPGAPPDVISPNRDLPPARKNQWSLDVQREIFRNTALDLQYVGSRTTNLDRSFFVNTPAPGPGAIQARRPNPAFGNLRIIQNDQVADYDAFTVHMRRRMTDGLLASVHYTYSRNRDMGTNSNAGGRTMDDFDIWRDYGPANWDIPHRFVASYLYEMPFFRDSNQLLLRHVLGGWQIGGVTTIQSGTPVNITIGTDRANTGSPGQRPDLVGSPSTTCGANNLVGCIDPSAYALPAQFTFGDAPRNHLRGPGISSTDLSLAKNFRMAGRGQLQVRVEAFNVFNQVNVNNPNGVFGTANFGRITSARPMRQIQLGGRFSF
ncbi:MAG: TonB-dependent receptor [Acidobacteria bacterium]|nr:TonB-dependent receptor [Acidobacteriota bacterium]